MKDRIEIRFTIATDELLGKDAPRAIGRIISSIAKRYAPQIDRIVEKAVKDFEDDEPKKDPTHGTNETK